jgi:hypothetical protein
MTEKSVAARSRAAIPVPNSFARRNCDGEKNPIGPAGGASGAGQPVTREKEPASTVSVHTMSRTQ